MKQLLLVLLALITFSLLVADTMPDFRLPDMNNQDVSLSDLLGKGPVLIDFWANWCNPCKQAMPYLNDLMSTYDSLTVVMISIDSARDIARAKNYLRGRNYNFIGLFDSNRSLADQLNVTNPPHTLILDKEGNIVYTHVGFEPGQERVYAEKIEELLHHTPDAE